jgi:hypothetical protein
LSTETTNRESALLALELVTGGLASTAGVVRYDVNR